MNTPHSSERGQQLLHALSPFESGLSTPGYTEIAINKPGEYWTEGPNGWERHEARELTFDRCARLAQLIATFNVKSIGQKNPILSGELPGKERVQIVMPPACTPSTVSMTIRRHNPTIFGLDDLKEGGSFALYQARPEGLQDFELELLRLLKQNDVHGFLRLAVKKHRNIAITGATGSGKTVVTNALMREIPLGERLITIQDVAELRPPHQNVVELFFSREEEGGHTVSAKTLLASSLRMKPDRLIVAEIRGDEAWEYLKALGTGHRGSITTWHADSEREAFDQLAAFVKDSKTGAHLDVEYVKHRIRTTIDIVLHYSHRKLQGIYYDPETRLQRLA
ncbi:P-type DNA transfer ATPase VirB11 [Achromobacter spanius]|uniref:P-type DNA transfer ATPase VirB11 n=1 Tax=Achromobacter spanius TaxID=217203 RepID=UPI0037F2808A